MLTSGMTVAWSLYTVTGLVPFTSYIVRVTTHNGVSDQDPNTHLRMCEVSNMTVEGGTRFCLFVCGSCMKYNSDEAIYSSCPVYEVCLLWIYN